MIKAVIFDLDDTLYCEKEYVDSGFKAVSSELERMTGVNRVRIYEMMQDAFKTDSRHVFDRTLQMLDVEYDKKMLDALVEIYRNHEPVIRLFCDADEILRYLREHRYGLGIITDGYACAQWKKIKALDLDAFMDHIIVTDDLGRDYWKPHMEPYRRILDCFGVLPDEAVYVGDNEEKDFISAKALGMRTVKITRETGIYRNMDGTDACKAEFEIGSLLELKALLRKMD